MQQVREGGRGRFHLLLFYFSDLPQYASFSVSIAAVTSEGVGPYSSSVTNTTFEGGKCCMHLCSVAHIINIFFVSPFPLPPSFPPSLPSLPPPLPPSLPLSHTVPSPPSSVITEKVNDTSIRVTWARPDQPNGNIIGYYIDYIGIKNNTNRVRKGEERREKKEYIVS